MKPSVVVIGSYVHDLCWRCPAFPRTGETTVGAFTSGPGGKGSNQAVAAGRLGGPTLFVGAVGRDVFAREARAFYRAEGIAARLVEKPRLATATAAIFVDAEGRNQIVLDLAANLALARRDVPIAAVRGARVVVTQLESNLATTAWALREARKAGVTTVLNTAPLRADFDPAMLRHVDIVVPNEIEFALLVNRVSSTGVRDFTEARLPLMAHADIHTLCRAIGVPTVIITLGGKGCFVSTADGFAHLPAHKVRAIDTTGAGDAFVGGLAAALAHGDSVLEAARTGNAVGALAVTRPGSSPSMPTARELATFLRRARRAV